MKSIVSLLLASSLVASSAYSAPAIDEAKAKSTLETYAANVYVVYTDAYQTVLDLQTAVDAFLAAPSEATHLAAKKAWLASRDVWGQTEAFRFYEGPIDDATYGVEGYINGWPLDEAYIDYVVGDDDSGIINDAATYPVIDGDTLLSLNEKGAETNIATGFHAVEFLLWGQDLSATGPGARPYTDFVVGEKGTAKNQDRRAAYLKAVTDLLVKQVGTVKDAWEPKDSKSYGAGFAAQSSVDGLTKVFKGMSSLLTDELAGERMYTGYESQSQEDEHSCFSDNTHRDIIENLQGVINVWTGTYKTVAELAHPESAVTTTAGVGVSALVSPAIAKRVTAQLNSALAAAKALPTPYDQLLVAPEGSDQRKQLLDTIFAVQDAGTAVREAAESLGLSIPVE